MIAKQLLSSSIPAVPLKETGVKVLSLMELYRLSHLPVVESGEYFGVISDQEIFDKGDFDLEMEGYLDTPLIQPHVHDTQHIFEIIRIAMGCNLTIVPVLSEEHRYLGAISIHELGNHLAELFCVHEPGGIIQLKMCEKDYSLVTITQIVEGNDAQILSLYTGKPSHNSTEILVTMKLNLVDLSGVIQTLMRYDYEIAATYSDQSSLKSLMDDRYDQFIRYMNV